MMYRREIDGLRAVAVLPVLFFHAGYDLFSGGFVGVDVFFVISGYLITFLLLEGLAQDRFSLLDFYARRARRIFPALFVVVLCSIFAGLAVMNPVELESFSESIISVALFASNIYFWKTNNYFSPVAEEQPMLHMWSLAVEEQFYIGFPVFLFLVWVFARRYTLWLILAGAAVSLAIAEWGWREHATANFYLPLSRAWELLVGAGLAFIMRERPITPSSAMSLIGLALIFASIFVYNEQTPFPSLYTVMPVLGTALVLAFASQENIAGRLLGSSAFVGVGLVSYSLYLWHQPVFAFARLRLLDPPGPLAMFGLILMSFALAVATWLWVEQPFRRRKFAFSKGPALAGSSALAIAGTVVFGIAGSAYDGLPWRIPADAAAAAAFASDGNPLREDCHFEPTHEDWNHPVAPCAAFMEDGRADVVFIGDSHSLELSYQTQLALQGMGISSYAVSMSGCVGLEGFFRVDQRQHEQCSGYNRAMLAYARQIGARTLVLTSRFPIYVLGTRFDNQEGGVEYGPPFYVDTLDQWPTMSSVDDPARQARVLSAYATQLADLAEEFNVVLVHPIPEVGWNASVRLSKCLRFNVPNCEQSTSYDVYLSRTESVRAVFEGIEAEHLTHFRPSTVLCDTTGTRRCDFVRDGRPLYYDDNHLADSTGAVLVGEALAVTVRDVVDGG